MGAPRYNHNDPIRGAIMELASAASALQMHPSPIEDAYGTGYLVDTDEWAQHSNEHIQSALRHLVSVDRLLDDMRRIHSLLSERLFSGQVAVVDINRAQGIAARYVEPIEFEEG